MPHLDSWYTGYTQEISHAEHARAAGNEGMARVCARRAAGIVIGEYLHRSGLPHLDSSAYQRLKLMETIPGLNSQTKQVVGHFLLSVDKNHSLPAHIDLLSEAQWLARELMGTE